VEEGRKEEEGRLRSRGRSAWRSFPTYFVGAYGSTTGSPDAPWIRHGGRPLCCHQGGGGRSRVEETTTSLDLRLLPWIHHGESGAPMDPPRAALSRSHGGRGSKGGRKGGGSGGRREREQAWLAGECSSPPASRPTLVPWSRAEERACDCEGGGVNEKDSEAGRTDKDGEGAGLVE
jgi:hypothetical protein